MNVSAINMKYCAQKPKTLVVTEKVKSFTGEDFKIKDAESGEVIFQIAGKLFSLREKKQLLDGNGNEIACFQNKKITSSPRSFEVYARAHSNTKLMTMKWKLPFLKSKMSATVWNLCDNGRELQIVMKGDWKNKDATISLAGDGGDVLATISRTPNLKNVAFNRKTFYLQINQGVDSAMIVLLALAFDEAQNNNSGSSDLDFDFGDLDFGG
jgi:uncharacterized protein YxjI